MPFRTILRTALTTALIAAATPVLAAEPTAPELRETKAIFKVILSEIGSIERCAIYPGWDGDSGGVPAAVARRYLGIETKQDVKPPRPAARFETLFDPGPIGAAAFCDAEADKSYTKELAATNSKDDFSFPHFSFTFPVFNTRHTRAVVLEGGLIRGWRREGGRLEEAGGFGAGQAVVLAKVHGAWKVIKRVQTWIT